VKNSETEITDMENIVMEIIDVVLESDMFLLALTHFQLIKNALPTRGSAFSFLITGSGTVF